MQFLMAVSNSHGMLVHTMIWGGGGVHVHSTCKDAYVDMSFGVLLVLVTRNASNCCFHLQAGSQTATRTHLKASNRTPAAAACSLQTAARQPKC
jgi:hypothetical protein